MTSFVEDRPVQRRCQDRLTSSRAFPHHVPTMGINDIACEVGHVAALITINRQQFDFKADGISSVGGHNNQRDCHHRNGDTLTYFFVLLNCCYNEMYL